MATVLGILAVFALFAVAEAVDAALRRRRRRLAGSELARALDVLRTIHHDPKGGSPQ